MTMQFNTLVLQVLRPLDEGFFPAPFGHVPEDRTVEIPVYPPGSEFYWPPQRSITRKRDLTKYARREQLED